MISPAAIMIALAVSVAMLATSHAGAQSTAATTGDPSSPAGAVRDFYYGLEHRDADRFCRAIVAKVDGRFERIRPRACKKDFHDGAFDGLLDGTKLLRVLGASIHHHHASVKIRLGTPHGERRASMTVYFAFGHWAVPIPAGR